MSVIISGIKGSNIGGDLINLRNTGDVIVDDVHGEGIRGDVVRGHNISGSITRISGRDVGGALINLSGGAVSAAKVRQLRELLGITSAVTDADIEDAVRRIDGIADREKVKERLHRTGLGAWAKANAISLADLAVGIASVFAN